MSNRSPHYLMCEGLLMFGALPAMLAWIKPHGLIYFVLWLVALLSCRTLTKEHGWNFRSDWNRAGLTREALTYILLRFLPFAAALLVFTWAVVPAQLFSLPLERPHVWAMVMVLYPLLSVLPQEIVFRSFFFRRYQPLLKNPRTTIIASAIAFGWVHIVLHNWVAIVFSAIGSLLFSHSYLKTRSLAAAFFEHALYGCFVFTVGLGLFFYHGAAVR